MEARSPVHVYFPWRKIELTVEVNTFLHSLNFSLYVGVNTPLSPSVVSKVRMCSFGKTWARIPSPPEGENLRNSTS